ncbi:MAG: hypothetical protein WCI04_02225, partial [archaeon]
LKNKLHGMQIEHVNKTIFISIQNAHLFDTVVLVLNEVLQKKFGVTKIDLKHASLEDVFINITGSKMGDA